MENISPVDVTETDLQDMVFPGLVYKNPEALEFPVPSDNVSLGGFEA